MGADLRFREVFTDITQNLSGIDRQGSVCVGGGGRECFLSFMKPFLTIP